MRTKTTKKISVCKLYKDYSIVIKYIPEVNGKCEVFCYYKYTLKNFPPSRELFSLCSDGEDIIVSGGITSNKADNLWSLNVGKLN